MSGSAYARGSKRIIQKNTSYSKITHLSKRADYTTFKEAELKGNVIQVNADLR